MMMMGKVFVLAAISIMIPIMMMMMGKVFVLAAISIMGKVFYVVGVHDDDDDDASTVSMVEEEEEYFESGSGSGSGSGWECAVCLSKVGRGEKYWVVGECRHGFHADCIRHWVNQHSTCPLCRAHVHHLPPDNTTTTRLHPHPHPHPQYYSQLDGFPP